MRCRVSLSLQEDRVFITTICLDGDYLRLSDLPQQLVAYQNGIQADLEILVQWDIQGSNHRLLYGRWVPYGDTYIPPSVRQVDLRVIGGIPPDLRDLLNGRMSSEGATADEPPPAYQEFEQVRA